LIFQSVWLARLLMSKRQSLEHRSALFEANQAIAYATEQLIALKSIIAELDRT
jgi:hypothetical protein